MLLVYVRIQSKDRHTPDFPWRQTNVWPVFVACAFRHTFFRRLSSRHLVNKQQQLPSVLIKYLCICSWICLLSSVCSWWVGGCICCMCMRHCVLCKLNRSGCCVTVPSSISVQRGVFSASLLNNEQKKPWNRFYHLHGQLRQIVGVDIKASTR